MFQIFMNANILIIFPIYTWSLGNINFQSLMWFHLISIMVRVLIFLSLFSKVPSFCTLFLCSKFACLFRKFSFCEKVYFLKEIYKAHDHLDPLNMLNNLKECMIIIENSIYSLALGLSKWTWCGHFASNVTLVSVLMCPSCPLGLTQGKFSLYLACPHYAWRSKIASVTKGLAIKNKFKCHRIYNQTFLIANF
jgi:hypothetical protein